VAPPPPPRHFDPAEDFLLLPGVPLDTLDFTSYTMNLGSKMVIDAQSHSRRVGSAGVTPGEDGAGARAPLGEVADPRSFDDRVAAWRLAWGGVLVAQVKGEVGGSLAGWSAASAISSGTTPGREVLEKLVRRPEYTNLPLIVAVSADFSIEDDAELLWAWFTRFDCARDLVAAGVESRGAWVALRGPLGIDATWKPGYPEPLPSIA
jgi:4-hydroxy-3-polyprenylbenzoate decarboxylase